MNNKILHTILPLFVLLALTVLAIFSSVKGVSNEWIPLIGGLGNIEALQSGFISSALSVAFIVAILFAIYCIIVKTNAIPIMPTFVIFLLLLLNNSGSFMFSAVYPALLCIVWMQFCILSSQIYISMLLLSLGSLFYAPLVWLFPIALVILIKNGISDPVRIAVKSLAGFLTPYIYMLVFRWIAFNDANVYLQHFGNELVNISLPFHLLHLTDYFLIMVVLYMTIKSLVFIYSKTPDGALAYIIKTETITLFVMFILVTCFYKSEATPVMNFTALPVAILLSYYYKNGKKRGRITAEFMLLMIAILMCSLSNILN